MTVAGAGDLVVAYAEGSPKGRLLFENKGKINLQDANSGLWINGQKYELVASVVQLANAVNENHSGHFALVRDYDAKKDGLYAYSPVSYLDGTFEGLGHIIRNVSVNVISGFRNIGFFSEVSPHSTIRNVGLKNLQITVRPPSKEQAFVGGLVGMSGDQQQGGGVITRTYTTGSIVVGDSDYAYVGGLVGFSEAFTTITDSHSDCAVRVGTGAYMATAGGLVGFSQSIVAASYATGSVNGVVSGGLIGIAYGYSDSGITASYASGQVNGSAYTGGLVAICSPIHRRRASDTIVPSSTGVLPPHISSSE